MNPPQPTEPSSSQSANAARGFKSPLVLVALVGGVVLVAFILWTGPGEHPVNPAPHASSGLLAASSPDFMEQRLISAWRQVRRAREYADVDMDAVKTVFVDASKSGDSVIAYEGKAGLAVVESILLGGGPGRTPLWRYCPRPLVDDNGQFSSVRPKPNPSGFNLWGFVNSKGEVVVEPTYWEVDNYVEGMAAVKKGDVETSDGEGSIKFFLCYKQNDSRQNQIPIFEGHPLPFATMGARLYTGMDLREQALGRFSEGIATCSLITKEKGRHTAYLDGRLFDGIDFVVKGEGSEFHEGLARLRTSGGYGFVDRAGKMAIPPKWASARDFSEGLAAVSDAEMFLEGRWVFINRSGDLAFPAELRYACSFSDGLAFALQRRTGGTQTEGYINRLGEWVFKMPDDWSGLADYPGFQDLDPSADPHRPNRPVTHVAGFSDGLAIVYRNENQFGFVDHFGALVIPFRDGSPDPFQHGMAAFWRKGKVGFLNKKGDEVIPPRWDNTFGFEGEIAVVWELLVPKEEMRRAGLRGPARWCGIDKTGKVLWSSDGKRVGTYGPPTQ